MNNLDRFELAGGEQFYEETFQIRAGWRRDDIARAARTGKRLPVSVLTKMLEEQSAEFWLWFSLQGPARREDVMKRQWSRLHQIAELHRRTWEMVQGELARRKDEVEDELDDE
jgi:hypothetical protein